MKFTVNFDDNGNASYNTTDNESVKLNNNTNKTSSDIPYNEKNYVDFNKINIINKINKTFMEDNEFEHYGIAMFPLNPNSFTLSSEVNTDILTFIVRTIKETTDDRLDIESNCYLIHLITEAMYYIKETEKQLSNLTFDIYKLDSYQISLNDVLTKLCTMQHDLYSYIRDKTIKRFDDIIENLEYNIPTNTLIYEKISYIVNIYYKYISMIIDILEDYKV